MWPHFRWPDYNPSSVPAKAPRDRCEQQCVQETGPNPQGQEKHHAEDRRDEPASSHCTWDLSVAYPSPCEYICFPLTWEYCHTAVCCAAILFCRYRAPPAFAAATSRAEVGQI